MPKRETFSAVIQKAEELQVRDHLLGFTVAARKVQTDSKQGSYHLVLLNHSKKTVSVTTYRKEELEKANSDYSDLEQQIEKGEPVQAVLVAAGPIKDLRRAYPNYFLDTREFLKQLTRIEKQLNV